MAKKKILIIEDEPDQVAMLSMRLEANNFDIISAADGREGLDKASDIKPDLILLDLILPNIDGYQVCKRLKKDDRTRSIPIIVVTASVTQGLEERCALCGADDVIRKPYDAKVLIEKINRLIN